MIRRLAMLIGGSLAFWVIVTIPSRHLWGDTAAVYSGVAVVLCLIPAAVTMAWAGWALQRTPDQQTLMVLGGTGVRMLVVLSAALVLYGFVPYFHEQGFWFWVLLFYLFTLALEMGLVLASRPATSSSPTNVNGSGK